LATRNDALVVVYVNQAHALRELVRSCGCPSAGVRMIIPC
jgi:hypothetical protein